MRDYKTLLIELRSKLIGALHQLPYTIYTDQTIDLLIKAKPKSLEELAMVKGFPPEGKRIKGFGETVIAIFNSDKEINEITVSSGAEPEVKASYVMDAF